MSVLEEQTVGPLTLRLVQLCCEVSVLVRAFPIFFSLIHDPLTLADVTDIASLMYWGHHDEATGRELRIRWDVYRSEDIDGVSSPHRAFSTLADRLVVL